MTDKAVAEVPRTERRDPPILCVDFDGVIHSYTSGWQGADVVSDPPVRGALEFLRKTSEHFQVAIYSSRSKEPGGIAAMQLWLIKAFEQEIADRAGVTYEEGVAALTVEMRLTILNFVRETLKWPTAKPAAFLSIDDRAICFVGPDHWPSIGWMQAFKPWNAQKKS